METIEMTQCSQKGCDVMVVSNPAKGDHYCSAHASTNNKEKGKVNMTKVKEGLGKGYKEAEDFISNLFSNLGKSDKESEKVESLEPELEKEVKRMERQMHMAFAKEIIVESSKDIRDFAKRHVGKSTLALGAVTLAGTFTTGMLSAVAVGTGIFTLGSLAFAYIAAKRKEEELEREEVSSILTSSLVYSTLGAMAMHSLAGFLVLGLGFLFEAVYVGYIYMAYFIVA